tara:strand:+ start:167 stop:547 length:381 start_codon:yes stop_codon:yes gene_type:complete
MSSFLKNIDHITILTDNLNSTINFYTKILDLKTADWRPRFSFSGAWLAIDNNAIIHLIEVKKMPSNSGNIDHFALQGKNIKQFKRKLKKQKTRFYEKVTPDNTIQQIFITDPNNIKIEITFKTLIN